MLFKWCINVSSIRTLMGANDCEAPCSSCDVDARSVTDRRIERRRPSESRTTTKAGPRAELDDNELQTLTRKAVTRVDDRQMRHHPVENGGSI